MWQSNIPQRGETEGDRNASDRTRPRTTIHYPALGASQRWMMHSKSVKWQRQGREGHEIRGSLGELVSEVRSKEGDNKACEPVQANPNPDR